MLFCGLQAVRIQFEDVKPHDELFEKNVASGIKQNSPEKGRHFKWCDFELYFITSIRSQTPLFRPTHK